MIAAAFLKVDIRLKVDTRRKVAMPRMNSPLRGWPALGMALLAVVCLAAFPARADWRKDAKEAAIGYADAESKALIQQKSKEAITALYKKIYRAAPGSKLPRALAEVAISAPELNQLAESMADAYASGDSDKIRDASQAVSVKFGEQLTRLASNPETKEMLGSILGKADQVKAVSEMLGNATSGTASGQRAAAEFIGDALIGLTPAAGVVGFYQTAYGVMKYAKGEYTDSKVEDLYEAYRKGDAETRRALIEEVAAGGGGYGYILRDRRMELEEQRTEAIGDAADVASDKVLQHLTNATEEEVLGSIVESFEARMEKERQDADREKANEEASRQAEAMIGELQDAYERKNGRDGENPYNLQKYLELVKRGLAASPEFDPNDPIAIRTVSRALSAGVVYGKDSPQYQEAAAALEEAREEALATTKGGPCQGSTKATAVRLWNHGIGLVNAGRAADAVGSMKKSLEICPDDKRAAKVAAIEESLGTQESSLDGSYGGPIKGNAGGTMTISVNGRSVSGTISGAYEGDAISGTVQGTIGENGALSTAVSGKLYDTKGSYSYAFTGTLKGSIDAASGSGGGSWQAKNQYGSATGSWSVTRR